MPAARSHASIALWHRVCGIYCSKRMSSHPALQASAERVLLSAECGSGALQDSEELLRNLHLAPYAKPIVSLIDDFPMVQRHKGWQFGYLQGNTARRMT